MSSPTSYSIAHNQHRVLPAPMGNEIPAWWPPMQQNYHEANLFEQEPESDPSNVTPMVRMQLPALPLSFSTDEFPDPAVFNEQLNEYLANLSDRKKEKALISRETYAKIQRVRRNKDNTKIETAQFRFWCRKQFHCDEDTNWEVYHQSRRICVREEIYAALCQAHLECNHGGRDKTSAKVREYYSYIPKDLIARFVKYCRTCEHRREAGRMTAAEVAEAGGGEYVSPQRQRPNIQVAGSSIGRRLNPGAFAYSIQTRASDYDSDGAGGDDYLRACALTTGQRLSVDTDSTTSAPVTPLDGLFPQHSYFPRPLVYEQASNTHYYNQCLPTIYTDDGEKRQQLEYGWPERSGEAMSRQLSDSSLPLPSPTHSHHTIEGAPMSAQPSGSSQVAHNLSNLVLQGEENDNDNAEHVIADSNAIRHWQAMHLLHMQQQQQQQLNASAQEDDPVSVFGYSIGSFPSSQSQYQSSQYAVSPTESISMQQQQSQNDLLDLYSREYAQQQQRERSRPLSAISMHSNVSRQSTLINGVEFSAYTEMPVDHAQSQTLEVDVDECNHSQFVNDSGQDDEA